jgi:prepilin-type N-terminal cleavage/methylation domain-containing protein
MRLIKNFFKFPNKSGGFTFVELIVVVAVIGIISSIVVFNHRKFSDSIELTNAAYELALLIREAQSAGSSIRPAPDDVRLPSGSSPFDFAYGVFFRPQFEDGDRKVVSFIDLDPDPDDSLPPDGRYAGDNNDDSFVCENYDECLLVYENFGRGNFIKRFCAIDLDGVISFNRCSDFFGNPNIVHLKANLTFLRPKLDGRFVFINPGGQPLNVEQLGIVICLTSPEGRNKMVRVLQTGQVSVEDPDSVCSN